MSEPISVTICGDGGTGKSSITLRLVRSQWTHEYDPTIEDSYTVQRHIDGTTYTLSLTDTAGQEEYRGLWTSSTLTSDAFLLVYDITSPSSLEALGYFVDLIELEAEARSERFFGALRAGEGVDEKPGRARDGASTTRPVLIVAGNKSDLISERRVSAREGLEWARARGCGFMETSARNQVNIEESFALLIRRVEAHRRDPGLGHADGSAAPAVAAKPYQTQGDMMSGDPNADLEKDTAGHGAKESRWWRKLICW
ncbi:MAG: hypothetical protein M1814_002536 [Vezdaea aestivalis]|nr:MAG: hypothetical protein M1814_002536 [Vezdaea aestivalis]